MNKTGFHLSDLKDK